MYDKLFTRPDLHLHSVFSDGTDTVPELIDAVRNAGIDFFSLTDHDSIAGCEEVRKYLHAGDPAFVNGVEFTCRDEKGEYHILGYAYRQDAVSMTEAVEFTHDARMRKTEGRLRFLQEGLGVPLTEEDLRTMRARRNPGKLHFARLLMEKGFAATGEEGLRLFDTYNEKADFLHPEAAIAAILAADGIPVLAHGILGAGRQKLSTEVFTERVERLCAAGLMGLEGWYSSYTPEQTQTTQEIAQRMELLVTAGSDYHGNNKPVRIAQNGGPDPEKIRPFCRAVAERLETK